MIVGILGVFFGALSALFLCLSVSHSRFFLKRYEGINFVIPTAQGNLVDGVHIITCITAFWRSCHYASVVVALSPTIDASAEMQGEELPLINMDHLLVMESCQSDCS